MPLRVAHQLAHRLMRYGPLAADPPIKLGATSAAVECYSGKRSQLGLLIACRVKVAMTLGVGVVCRYA